MYCKLRPSTASTLADDLIAAIDAGASNATIAVYTGTPPTNPTVAHGSTLLGTLTCSATPATQTDGTITFGTITQDSAADASGTAAWARIYDGDGAGVVDLDVSNDAGAGAVKLNTTTIVAGGPILLSALVIAVGG